MHEFHSLKRRQNSKELITPFTHLPVGVIPPLASVPCLVCEGCVSGAASDQVKPETICVPWRMDGPMDLVGSASAGWGSLGLCVTKAGEAVASGRPGELNQPLGPSWLGVLQFAG